LTFLNVNEINIRVDASQFKQNEIEVIVIIELVKIYAEVKISVKNIIILCMMKIKKLNFMSQFNCLLTVCNHACNLFVVLYNYDEL